MAKFKVGDKVIGNDLANRHGITCKGWVGYVKKVDGKSIHVEDATDSRPENRFWVDSECFDLAEEKPTPKPTFKVGDRVIASDNCNHFKEKPGTIVELWHDMEHPTPYGVEFDKEDGSKSPRLWSKVHSLIKEEPTPTPVVNLNVTVNLYENACWYCRKGGLVDLYLAGAMGICPSCGRVCNNTVPTKPKKDIVIEFKTPEKPKENRPLTTEELKALPDGTRVFTVHLDRYKREDLVHEFTCWRTKNGDSLERKNGRFGFGSNGSYYNAYLEKPEKAVDSGK